MNVALRLREASMTRYHYVVVFLCFLLQVVDGLDLLITSFAVPYLPAGFASSATKGYILSAALVGMGIGAVGLGTVADRFGRRKVNIGGTLLLTGGSVISALAQGPALLMTGRLITGIGVGACIVTAVVMVNEYTPESRRNLNASLQGVGFPVGAFLVGVLTIPLIEQFGTWRALFWFGAALSAVIGVLQYALMPESIAYLLNRRPAGYAGRVRRILSRLDVQVRDEDLRQVAESAPDRTASDSSLGRLLSTGLRRRTLLIWVSYLGLSCSSYFVSTWTPQLIATASGDKTFATLVGTAYTIGGVVGTLLFGLIGLKMRGTKISYITLSLAAVAMLAFGFLMGSGWVAFGVTIVIGIAFFVATTAPAAVVPSFYPVELRAGGYGSMLAIGRIGAIATPILVGYLVTAILPKTMYFLAAIPLVIAAVAAIALHRIGLRELGPDGGPRDTLVTADRAVGEAPA